MKEKKDNKASSKDIKNTAKKEPVKEVKKEVKEKVKEEKVVQPEVKKQGGFYLSYRARMLINFLVIVVFIIISFIFLLSSFSVQTKSNVVYTQNGNTDYKVYLKANDYYKEPFLGKNMQYIAALIDYISVDLNYNFSANQNINYRYDYSIKADVTVSNDDGTKIIYSKSEKLKESNYIVRNNSNGFVINENLKIDYEKYNNLVKEFKSSYALNADSNLIITLMLNVTDEKGYVIGNLSNKDVMTLTIPLTEQMVSISIDNKGVNNKNTASIYKDFSISNKVNLFIAIVCFVVALIFIIKLLLFIKKTSAKRTIYDVTLAKILREYDRVIVNSKSVLELNDEIIDVKSFNELLDVRDNLEKPIIFYEIHKGQKSMFAVKTPNETYRYILKLVDLEESKNNNNQ